MKFEEMFKAKQVEMEMNHAQFAKYIGRHRTWVMDLWNPKKPRRPLRNTTMYMLHNRLGIPFEVMEEYNAEVLAKRGQ